MTIVILAAPSLQKSPEDLANPNIVFADVPAQPLATDPLNDQVQLMLGKFIARLETYPAAARIRFDFPNGFPEPGIFHSYRGYYEHAAIGYGDNFRDVTVGQILDAARRTDGAILTGYKEGDYLMGPETPLWVANDWEATQVAIVDTDLCTATQRVVIRTWDMRCTCPA